MAIAVKHAKVLHYFEINGNSVHTTSINNINSLKIDFASKARKY